MQLSDYPTIYIYCTEGHLSFCNYINENFAILRKQVNCPLPKKICFFPTLKATNNCYRFTILVIAIRTQPLLKTYSFQGFSPAYVCAVFVCVWLVYYTTDCCLAAHHTSLLSFYEHFILLSFIRPSFYLVYLHRGRKLEAVR